MAAPGPKSDKLWAEAVRMAALREDIIKGEDGSEKKVKRIRLIADNLVRAAVAGDIQAIKEVGDRLDGKAKQQSEVSGPDGGSIPIALNIRFGKS